jgi:GTP cyclohydrolase I
VNGYDQQRVTQAVSDLLDAVGEDANRQGLAGTPDRVARAWDEMLAGYRLKPGDVLTTHHGEHGFTGIDYAGIVVLAGYRFTSVCEHHLLPFMGEADVGYLPNTGDGAVVVGLSKLGRLVDLYARRLQVQERLTQQIATALDGHLKPRGVAVRIRAKHLCMECRGVGKGGTMGTEVVMGDLESDHRRREFWHLCEPMRTK